MTVSELSATTGFSKRNVQDSANELADARVIQRASHSGPAKFQILPERWFRLLYDGETTIEYRPWPAYLSAYRKLVRWLWWASESTLSDYLIASSATQLLRDLEPLDIYGGDFSFEMRADEPELLGAIQEMVEYSFRDLRPSRAERAN